MHNTKPDLNQIDFLFSKISEGFAYCQIITDEKGKPIDWVYLDVNDAYERINGVKKADVIGKKATEVLPTIQRDPADWVNLYGHVALTGEPVTVERYAQVRQRWYHISAYSPEKGYFMSVFEDISERKKIEAEIRKAKEDWERTFTAVPDLIAVLDTNYRIKRANKAMAQQLGVTPEETVGLTCYECIHGTTTPPDYCPHTQLLKDGKPHTSEVHEPRLGGDFLVSDIPLKDEEGQLIGSIHIARNITERKKSEDALKESEAKYRGLFTNMMDGFAHCQMIYDKEGKPVDFVYLDVNEAFEKLTGLRKETVLGKKVSEAIPGTVEANPELIKTYDRVASTGKSERFEIHFKPLSKWFSVSVYSERKGFFIAIFQDVTQRKQAEEAVRESEQRWSTTLTSIGDAVIATDTEGKITFMNPVAEELTGWTLGEAKQKPIKKVFNIINEHTRKEVESPVTKVLQEGLIVGLANHTVLIRKNGTEVPIDDSGAPIIAEDSGAIRGVVLVFRDITERKKNEGAIQRQASLIDLSPDAIIVRALDGTITFWSKGAERLYGWTKKEAMGKSIHALFKTKFPEPFDSIMDKLKAEKKWSGELIHCTKTGQEVIVQSWWQAEETEHGKIKSILESNVDITERKKAEQSLRESEEMLKRSQEIAHLGSWELDVKENRLIWSDEVYRIFGLKPQEFGATYDAFLTSVYPDDREAVDAAYSSSIQEGKEGYEIEHRVVRKDTGEIRVVHEKCTHFRDESGQVIKSLGMVHDITERKSAEREIERLASFPTLNPSPVLEVDAQGKITYINPATKRLFPTLEAEGLKHIFFYDWKYVTTSFEDKNTSSFGREVKINEHWYHQQFYIVPQTKQIRIYSTDIDELKQTEQARAKAQTKLEENAVMLEEYASQMEELAEQRAQQLQNSERLAAIGQTAGMVGHDIRNPLQAITSDMYIISEEAKAMTDGENKEAIMESIDSVNQNLGYINKIVSDLQDYTRPLKPNLQNANLSELIEGTLLTINVPKGIEVTTDIAGTAKPINTDVAYMRRILTNLMTNAVQAMQEDGKLTIQAAKKKDAVMITVQDTGVGIPDEVKAKMFTPLFTTKSKGQGLGLAVVKRLVEALKGTIVFESVAGKGTKFIVELPQKQ